MRYVLAIAALAISGVLLLLGIGQRTFLAGPVEILHTVAVADDAEFAVISSEELSKVPGQANILMRGDTAFVAVAKTRDIEGWLAPFGHDQVAVDPTTKKTTSTPVPAEAPTSDLLQVDDSGNAVPIDPRGSDLWLDSRDGADGVFRLPVSLTENQSVLIAGNGDDPIPSGTSIAWVQDRNTPWAGPLFVGAGAFALLGAMLYLLAFDRDKRALGPRRGRKGPLLGVQNVVGGMRRRNGDVSEGQDAPKQGGRSNAAELPVAAAQAAAPESDVVSTDEVSTDAVSADTGEIVLEAVDSDPADAAETVDHPDEIVVEDVDDPEETTQGERGDDHAK